MADKYIVTHNDMVSVADEIRAKSGLTDSLTFPLGWKEAIQSMKSEEQLPSVDLPDYVRTEAMEVANKVRSVLKDDSIVSIKISDSHYVGDTATSADNKQSDTGNIHACMAIKALRYLLPIDYIAHMGDVGAGTVMQDNPTHKKEITDYLKYFREAVGNVPVFVAIGNHDTAIYYHNKQTDGGIHTLPGNWLYENFTVLSESDDTVISGEANGGYCYRDFEDKKLRVFLLNTSERLVIDQQDKGLSEFQKLWVAKALKELNTKNDASLWGFVVLCHYALDNGEVYQAAQIFKDYLDGDSYTANGETVNFSGYNGAKFYAQFHGHWHCFKSDNLHADMNWQDAGGTLYPYEVWRLCTPNASYNSENNYKDKIVYGVSFGEDTGFHKTPNSAEDTSFLVDVINPSESKIYSFCYGAGYDRTIDMNETAIRRYGVSKTIDLTQVKVTNESGKMIEEGGNYSATIVPLEDVIIESITVTMGGVDITSTAYDANTGVIAISNVTGTIAITVVSKGAPINLVKLATTTLEDGEMPFGQDYNGDGIADGYQKDMVLGSSSEYVTAEFAGGVTTGWIYCKPNKVTLTLKNFGTEDIYYTKMRITAYSRKAWGSSLETIYLKDITPDSEGNLIITPSMWTHTHSGDTITIRVSGKWTGNPPEIYAE